MTPTTHYDAILIGAGQAGGPLSTALAEAGRSTALIERVHVGGTCINEGCTPTKTMVASGRVAYLARRGADYGVRTGPVEVDMVRVRQRKRDIVDSFRGSNERRIAAAPNGGIALTVRTSEGERALTGSHLLAAAGRAPNTDTLNLAAAGVEIDARGFIKVDERLATTAPGVYAIGDIKGGPAFTHIS